MSIGAAWFVLTIERFQSKSKWTQVVGKRLIELLYLEIVALAEMIEVDGLLLVDPSPVTFQDLVPFSQAELRLQGFEAHVIGHTCSIA